MASAMRSASLKVMIVALIAGMAPKPKHML